MAELDAPPTSAPRTARRVASTVNYVAPTPHRPRYHANDSSRDTIVIDPQPVTIEDMRGSGDPPRLDREGFALIPHHSAVADFSDRAVVASIHPTEIRDLLLRISGADEVVISGPGILRFGERSALSGKLDNSRPARFVHIDISDATAAQFAGRSSPRAGQSPRRVCNYNVWRTFSPPPQDAPLTLCDARTVAPADLILADAVFDAKDGPEWSFEGLVIGANPDHRWIYASDMNRDEVWVFVTNDSDPINPHHVPHSAFDDPGCPADAGARASIEMRGIAFWY
jgi:hypothetical protein